MTPTHPIPRRATTSWLNKIPSQTKKHAYTPAKTTPLAGSARTAWGSRATPAGALARTCRQNRKTSPVDKLRSTPSRFGTNRPGARGLHPWVRSRAPAGKTKILHTILPESPGGSGAPVGFINPGSLMDRLPNKGSAQQTTLRATRNSWAGPNT